MTGYKNKPNGWLIKLMEGCYKPKKICGKQSTPDSGKHIWTPLKVQKPNMS